MWAQLGVMVVFHVQVAARRMPYRDTKHMFLCSRCSAVHPVRPKNLEVGQERISRMQAVCRMLRQRPISGYHINDE
jgi:hypothetical protein